MTTALIQSNRRRFPTITKLAIWFLVAAIVGLKLSGLLLWGWWAVLSPLWAPPFILFVGVPAGGYLLRLVTLPLRI
jgi:cytochrome b subunit of formate dehydrogenase